MSSSISEEKVPEIPDIEEPSTRLDPAKEDELVKEAEIFKNKGNDLFKNSGDYIAALTEYQNALKICPNYLNDKIAIYWGNISACQFQLEKYQEAVDSCTKALEKDPQHIKARLRRASANQKLDTWASLESALEDLQILFKDEESVLGTNRETVIKQLSQVEPRLKVRKETEADEMLGKLKTMGNDLLKNFGISLDNFKMDKKDDGTYSMNFK